MARSTFTISAAQAGQTLAAVLRDHLALSWSAARRLIQDRRVRLSEGICSDPTRRVRAGQRLEIQPRSRKGSATTPQGSGRSPTRTFLPQATDDMSRGTPIIRHADEHIVVVDKPAGLTTMRHPEETAEFGARARRFLPPTLADLLPALLGTGTGRSRGARKAPVVRAVHRLDKETSGLVVFARTVEAEGHLGRQFRAHTIERRYLAIVRGRARAGRIESFLIRDRGDGRRGNSLSPGVGQRAVSHVRVIEELGSYTLVECRLETGRTHQVRIHLGEAGTPICGESVYDRPLHGAPLPDASGSPRLALHAATLGFEHPASGRRLSWTSPLPPDLTELLEKLRGNAGRGPSLLAP